MSVHFKEKKPSCDSWIAVCGENDGTVRRLYVAARIEHSDKIKELLDMCHKKDASICCKIKELLDLCYKKNEYTSFFPTTTFKFRRVKEMFTELFRGDDFTEVIAVGYLFPDSPELEEQDQPAPSEVLEQAGAEESSKKRARKPVKKLDYNTIYRRIAKDSKDGFSFKVYNGWVRARRWDKDAKKTKEHSIAPYDERVKGIFKRLKISL